METTVATDRAAAREPGRRAAATARRLARLPDEGRATARCALVVLAVVSVVLGCRVVDTDGITPVPQLLAFLPWLLVPALLGLLLSVAARWPLGCGWALLAAAATGWFIQPYDPGPAPAPDGPVAARLRVLTANLEFGRATDGLLAALRRERPDVASVQECDAACADALGSAAVRRAYPYRIIVTGSPAEGSAILSNRPLTRERDVPGELSMPGAVARIAGVRLRLQVAHPMPPMPGRLDVWRTELGRLRTYAAGRGDQPTLIAGDFNATQDHAAFRDLLDTGMRDSARAAGVSRTPSWPSTTTPVLGAQIDHVLVSDALRPRTARFLDLGNTDHRALLVDLDLHAR
ncbi:endonuclease/exonuclease/phosphatase family protein [Streptomyces botrytidirepellens]|uniref:Endonuclease/exonuclease/phosphatase family protein n=1 Tax=Streptomyces botrytidirepellens TaxID=2486417 RepID=A0A3M8SU03_9ACTN|nr:endonuclease/exonuclease/phosphatase family protein [Streptomyces botrytidirepellens]RNF82714.1 endonuclease/exonuclease/phosphatase family protein [Streptomyces botrytidirepellens]